MSGTIYLIVIVIVALNVAGDFFLKIGSDKPESYLAIQTQLGAIMYALSAYGWIYVMQRVNLATVGVLYSTMTIIILTFLSIFIFKEHVSTRQLIGVVLAIAAVVVATTD